MDEVEKFKVKLIRDVMRHRITAEAEPEEMWTRLSKETGRDCEFLWRRMVTITKKKAARLLAVDDERARVPPGARMSLSDWQLVDLVLVYEKIDFIGSPESAENAGPDAVPAPTQELPALRRLFELVKTYQLETSSIFTRTRRWAQLSLDYNKDGRECSPMLLQRRWYQLKERARTRFYEFWVAYRGNKSLLARASSFAPGALEIDIARLYSAIVTQPFPEWEELVRNRTVVLPEHFERLGQRSTDLRRLYKDHAFVTRDSLKPAPAPATTEAADNEPDLVLVEPQIDTIELDDDSDTEMPEDQHNREEPTDQYDVANAAVAGITEGLHQDGLSNVQIVETTHMPTEVVDNDTPSQSISKNVKSPPLNGNNEILPGDTVMTVEEETDFTATVSEPDELDSLLTAVVAAVNANVRPEVEPMDVEETELLETVPERKEIDSDASGSNNLQGDRSPENPEAVEQVLQEKLDAIREETQAESRNIDSDENDTLFISAATGEDNLKCLVSKIKEDLSQDTHKESTEVDSSLVIGELPNNLQFIDDGIDFIEDSDDDDDDDMIDNSDLPVEVKNEAEPEKEEQPKFDLKLMMLPVVYTTKLELMKCLEDSDFQSINTSDILDLIVGESKPVSALSVNIKYEVETSLDNNVDKNSSVDLIKISEVIPEVPLQASGETYSEYLFEIKESDKVPSETAEMGAEKDSDSSDSSDEGVPECKRAKLTSSLFKKPKGCTYNPIQLCKNPDFNTRLRRLPTAFLTYERNRRYLNRLKPITIDLHKTFEQKLIDKTVYLFPNPNAPAPVIDIHQHSVTTSVIPTAMPAQSLLDISKNNENSEVVNVIDEELAQRKNKVIELPDIVKVRRINQHLLTAEVSPIQVINDQATRPFLEISPLCNLAGTLAMAEKISDDARNPEVSQDDHPLLKTPKAGEITRVKVELMDDEDDDQTFAQTPVTELSKNESSKNESQHQSTGITPIDGDKPPLKVSRKYTPKGTKEYPKRPWYLAPLVPVNSHFELKDSNMPWYQQQFIKTPLESGLLTYDTLNKMIYVIEGKDDSEIKKKSHKKAPEAPQPVPIKDDIIDLSTAECAPEDNTVKEEKSIDVPTVVETAPQKTCKTRVRNPPRQTFCCWANRVMMIKAKRQRGHSKKSWLPKHKCPKYHCVCCCREQLAGSNPPEERVLDSCCWASKMIKIFKERKKYESIPDLPKHYCVTTGNRKCKCCCKEPLDLVADVVEKICQSAKEAVDVKETSKAVHFINKPIPRTSAVQSGPSTTVINDGIVPFEYILQPLNRYGGIKTRTVLQSLECNETIDLDLNGAETNPNLSTHEGVNAGTQEYVADVQVTPNVNNSTDAQRSINTSTESDQFIVLSDDEADAAVKDSAVIVGANNILAPDFGKAIVNAPKKKTVVVPPRPKFIIKCFKNLMHACPVRLGPNKILLTTAKIPTELLTPQPKAVVSPRLASQQPVALMSNVNLPKGVHLVMEPSGKLACAFEANVNFDENIMEELKNLVSIVQEQLDNQLMTVEAPPVVGSVILSDDENSGDKVAKQTSTESQAENDHLVTSVEMMPVENNSQCTSQVTKTQDALDKAASEELVGHSGTRTEPIVCESDGRGDVTLQRPVENTADNITDVTSTEDKVSENRVDDIENLSVQVAHSIQPDKKLSEQTVGASQSVEKLSEDIADASQPVEKLCEDVADITRTVKKLLENTADGSKAVENISEAIQDASQPVENPPDNIAETSRPVEKPSENVPEDSKVVEKLLDDITDASQPVENLPEDIAETSKPAEKLLENIAEGSKAVEKLSKDLAGASQPVEKLPKTIAEASQQAEKLSEEKADVSQPMENTSEHIAHGIQPVENLSQGIADGTQPVQKLSKNTSDGGETYDALAENEEKRKQNKEIITREENNESKSPCAEESEIQQDTETANEITESGNKEPLDLEHTTEAVIQEQHPEEVPTQPSISTKKSILSDLMEMSGISSEDTLPPVENNLSLIQAIAQMPTQPPVCRADPEAPTELTQVTNVAALKFAVANHGKFFRYTIGTGALAAIEVALQSSRSGRPVAIGPTPVVDLTKGAATEVRRVEPTRARGIPTIIRKLTGSRLPVLTIGPRTATSSRSILKPPLIRLPERRGPGRPRKLPLGTVLNPQAAGGGVRRKRGRPRKQLLDNTVLNLDATDGEMEEEYLISSESEEEPGVRETEYPLRSLLRREKDTIPVDTQPEPQVESSEAQIDLSSEDEPLIEIARRRKHAKKLMKRERKLAKKQLKLIQRAAGTYSIVPAEASDGSLGPESVPEEVAETPGPRVIVESIPQIVPEPVPSEVEAETEPMTDSVATQLEHEGEAWLDPSDDDSDNFILGA